MSCPESSSASSQNEPKSVHCDHTTVELTATYRTALGGPAKAGRLPLLPSPSRDRPSALSLAYVLAPPAPYFLVLALCSWHKPQPLPLSPGKTLTSQATDCPFPFLPLCTWHRLLHLGSPCTRVSSPRQAVDVPEAQSWQMRLVTTHSNVTA